MWLFLLLSLLPAIFLPLVGCSEKQSPNFEAGSEVATSSRKETASKLSKGTKSEVSSRIEQSEVSECLLKSAHSVSASSVVTSMASEKGSAKASSPTPADQANTSWLVSHFSAKGSSTSKRPTSSGDLADPDSVQSSVCDDVSVGSVNSTKNSKSVSRRGESNHNDSSTSIGSVNSSKHRDSTASSQPLVRRPRKLRRLLKYREEQDSLRQRKSPKWTPKPPRKKNIRGILPWQMQTLTPEEMMQKAVDPDDVPIIELNTAREIVAPEGDN